ncbi:hypothetical protein DPSP01_003228 [Paraphaeosphaeria sporulosa]
MGEYDAAPPPYTSHSITAAAADDSILDRCEWSSAKNLELPTATQLQYVPPRTRQQDRGPQDAEPLPYWDNSSPFVLNLIGEPALTREMVKTDWLHSLSLTAIMHRSVLKYHRSLCPPSTSTSPSTRTSSPQNPTTNIFSLK